MSKPLTKLSYTECSDRKCRVCNRPIKQNVTNRIHKPDLCYVCYKVSTGQVKSVYHKKIKGGGIRQKHIDYRVKQDEQIKQYQHTNE